MSERGEERFNSAISLAQATGDGEVAYLALKGHRHTDMIRHDLRFPTGANHMGQFLTGVWPAAALVGPHPSNIRSKTCDR